MNSIKFKSNQIESLFFYRLAIIEQENRQIEREIARISNQTKIDESKSIKLIVDNIDTSLQPQTGHRRVPGLYSIIFFFINRIFFMMIYFNSGLTFEEETNLKSLEKYYDFLREKYSRLEENATTKFTLKEKRIEMQNLFERKLAELDKEREQRLTLRNRLRLYHLVWRTIKKYIEQETSSSSNINTNSILLEDFIMNAIYQSVNLFPKSYFSFILI